jgi:hypothetical protein
MQSLRNPSVDVWTLDMEKHSLFKKSSEAT